MKKTLITVLLIAMVGPLVLNLSALFYTGNGEQGAILATSKEQKSVSSDIDINTTNDGNTDNENEISEESKESQSQAPEQSEIKKEVVVARPNRADYNLSTTTGRENYIWDRLRSAGFSRVQVAAILGNMYVENSTLTLSLQEKGNNIGYGLIQWSKGRRDNLNAFAEGRGGVDDIDCQLDFFIHEYNTTGWGSHTEKRAEFRTTEDVRRAAYLFCWGFERPSEIYAHESRREERAVEVYNRHAN